MHLPCPESRLPETSPSDPTCIPTLQSGAFLYYVGFASASALLYHKQLEMFQANRSVTFLR